MSDGSDDYEQFVLEAEHAHSEGWDFGWLAGRSEGSDPSWSYLELARESIARATHLVDVDTGGGEFLASLAPLPSGSCATEGWPPNVTVATDRLTPLGVEVIASPGGALPFPDSSFDLVLNRHGALDSVDSARVLASGGRLLTQQVGSDDSEELNELLDAPRAHVRNSWTLAAAVDKLTAAGLTIDRAEEEWPDLRFFDVGAVVFQLQAVAWQIPDFTPLRYESALRELHTRIRREGALAVRAHRFLIVAHKD